MNLLILSTTEEEYNFFKRFIKSFSKLGWDIYLLTQIPSLKLKVFFNQGFNSQIQLLPITVQQNELSGYFKQTFNEYNFDIVFIWNGNGIISKELSEVCEENNQKTIYFELSNIHGKLFVDNLGVNTKSNLFVNPNYLGKYHVSDEEYNKWLDNYLEDKKINKRLPQANFIRKINLWFVYDYLFYKFSSVKPFGEYRLLRKILFFLNQAKTNKIQYDDFEVKKDYIFLPLQVSNDTQLILNSKVNNLQAVSIAKSIADDENCELIVKIHPAETDSNLIKRILDLSEELKFRITNANTFMLIENSKNVITINSTVGLESQILGKEVIFLGESFFNHFNYEDIKSYILRFLFDIDPFGKDDIDVDNCKKVMDIALFK